MALLGTLTGGRFLAGPVNGGDLVGTPEHQQQQEEEQLTPIWAGWLEARSLAGLERLSMAGRNLWAWMRETVSRLRSSLPTRPELGSLPRLRESAQTKSTMAQEKSC